jgi:pimeloyl-ACP methyl ester carboxylesterase
MYHRSNINVPGGTLFYRHTEIDSQKPTLLCIHGLGDSGLVFLEAFYEVGLRNFNIIVPDLVGYGKSASEADDENEYKFEIQIVHLYKLLEHLGVERFFLVGHSMGGDIGTLMCKNDHQKRIRAFVNVEGDLTQGDRFITNAAFEAHKKGRKYFINWLHNELIDIIFKDKAAKYMLSRTRYEKSLKCCSDVAFWTNVKRIRRLNKNLPCHHYAQVAKSFKEISIPKIFYWGSDSLSGKSKDYLLNANLKPEPRMFPESFHWIMLDNRRKFYDALSQFLQSGV